MEWAQGSQDLDFYVNKNYLEYLGITSVKNKVATFPTSQSNEIMLLDCR